MAYLNRTKSHTSMPYLSLASPLRQKTGMHGRPKQASRQQRMPLWPRSLPLRYCRQGRQQKPQIPI